MFNLIDVIVLAIVFLSAFIGYKRGLIKTIIGLTSFIVAIVFAFLFYKPVAVIISEQTTIDEWIVEHLEKTTQESKEEAQKEEASSNEVVSSEFSIQDALEKLPSAIIEKIDLEDAKAKVRHEIAMKVSELIMNLLSLIIIFVIIKVTLFIAELLLIGFVKLPVIKQINEILGMGIGAFMGFVEIYVAFALITFLSSVADISFVVDAIKTSALASSMFENNLLIKLMF